LLVNPDVILGHVPIGKPLFEFAAAARTTDLLNVPHSFHRAIDIIDDKACPSFNNDFGNARLSSQSLFIRSRQNNVPIM